MKKRTGLFLLVVVFSTVVHAQWDCRSIIGRNMIPIWKKSPLTFGTELAGSYGVMNDRQIVNTLLYVAIDYTKNKHQIYIEGGYKGYYNSLGAPTSSQQEDGFLYSIFQENRIGGRELFYKYSGDNTKLKLGFMSLSLQDYMLVNERAFAIKYDQKIARGNFNFTIGNVLEGPSRTGVFCGTDFLYNVIYGKKEPVAGHDFFESNFVTASYLIDRTIKKSKKDILPKAVEAKPDSVVAEEFDEFSSFDDAEFASPEETTKKHWALNKYGIIYYSEFGSYYGGGFEDMRHFYGLLAQARIPLDIETKIEVLHQLITNNNALVFMAEAERNFAWKNSSNSGIGIKYYNLIGIDPEATFSASFTNLFMGEVMRLDAIDLPLISVYAEHTGKSKVKPYVKLQHVMQTQSSKIQETDLEIGVKHLTKHIRCTGIFSRIATDALSEDYYMARVELRIAI